MLCPAQITAGDAVAVTVGTGLTIIVRVAVLLQPARVYVTVYVVVDPGDTVIDGVVAPPGDQEYVPPEGDPDAVRDAAPPAQIVTEAGAMLTVGIGFTVTTTFVGALVQPAEVAVTEYVTVPVAAAVVVKT